MTPRDKQLEIKYVVKSEAFNDTKCQISKRNGL